MTNHSYSVDASEQGLRIDALLANLEGVNSRAMAARLIERGAVELNGVVTTTKKRVLCAGDILTYSVEPKAPLDLAGEYLPLDIRFEDGDLIVLSKEAGMVCHPSYGHNSGTLVNALIAHCGYGNLTQLQGDNRPGIVHRLDKDTSGLMLVAKTDKAGLLLQDGIRTRNIDRRYLALAHGYIAPDTGLIDAPIARGESDRQKMVVSDSASARPSVTTFTVLERFEAGIHDEGYTLLECKLYTGRTHQIRVHLNYIAHPCVGDPLYGKGHYKAQLGLTRQFLHSYRLELEHPISGAPLRLLDPLPDDLQAALDSLDGRSMGCTAAGEDIIAQLWEHFDKEEIS
jgi:23S rRNA pseudouridine1911/1915/1917 synthase